MTAANQNPGHGAFARGPKSYLFFPSGFTIPVAQSNVDIPDATAFANNQVTVPAGPGGGRLFWQYSGNIVADSPTNLVALLGLRVTTGGFPAFSSFLANASAPLLPGPVAGTDAFPFSMQGAVDIPSTEGIANKRRNYTFIPTFSTPADGQIIYTPGTAVREQMNLTVWWEGKGS